jgi:hypothetical protein
VIGLTIRAWWNQIVMRIGLISDTHIPEACEHLPKRVFEVFAGIDLVMHAGDESVEGVTRFGAILEIGKHGEVSAEIISLG